MFPLEYLAAVDGYLYYLRPIELPLVFACGWLIYFLAGVGIAISVGVPVFLVARMLRATAALWARRICAWLALSLVGLAFAEAAILWVGSFGMLVSPHHMTLTKAAIYVAMFPLCAVWMWRRPSVATALWRAATMASIAALAICVASPLALVFLPIAPLRAAPSPDVGKATHPNIVLISMDGFAANHASLYGYARPTTPGLEAFASSANVFDHYYANSNFTTPSINSFINGVRPWTHRALQLEAVADPKFADGGLIARLQRGGYVTLAVATNQWAAPYHNGNTRWLERSISGQTHEFCSHFGTHLFATVPYTRFVYKLLNAYRACRLGDRAMVELHVWPDASHYDPELAFGAARQLLEERDATRPFFLWVHIYPPHDPYATPAPFVGRFDPGPAHRSTFNSEPPGLFTATLDPGFPGDYVGRYDEGVAYADYHVFRFLGWLKEHALYDGTLIAVTADHGESFAHGYGQHTGPELYEDLIHVPLIIKTPGQNQARRLNVLCEQVDLMPTLLDLAGVAVVGPIEGQSLGPAIRGMDQPKSIFSMNFEQSRRLGKLATGTVAMIEGQWKYVRFIGAIRFPYMPKLEDALYDIAKDPDENVNLVDQQKDVAAHMRESIDHEIQKHGGPLE